MAQGWLNVLLLIPIFLFCLSVHEFAHAWVAVRLGDLTPYRLGRLSLHPLAHADLIGTLALPILCVFYGWPFFGWAKPVPIDIRNLKRGRRDMAIVAAAGPAANVGLALASTALLFALVRIEVDHKIMDTVRLFTVVSIQVNVALAFFNLLPIPPLDGFNILQGFLPRRALASIYKITPAANILLLVLLVSGGLSYLGRPIGYFFRFLVQMATG